MAITQNAGKEGSVIVEYLLKCLAYSRIAEGSKEWRCKAGLQCGGFGPSVLSLLAVSVVYLRPSLSFAGSDA